MTQAYNLAILANAVDTSGRLNVGTNATGTLPVANGGTGTTTPSLVAGTNISITGTWPNQTITNTSSASGTVTSVATGNGLQGGTITTSGTLSVACPGFNTVGSYVFAYVWLNGSGANVSSGGSYAAGTSGATNQIWSVTMVDVGCSGRYQQSPNISGTWRWMSGPSNSGAGSPIWALGIACRIS